MALKKLFESMEKQIKKEIADAEVDPLQAAPQLAMLIPNGLSREEGELFDSSQEADDGTITAPKKAAKRTTRKRPEKRSGCSLRKRYYQRAVFILAKIAKNEEAGEFSDRDRMDKVKYEKIVDEYVNSRSTAKKDEPKDCINEAPRENTKRRKIDVSTNFATTPLVQTTSEVFRDDLQVALIDEMSNCWKPVAEVWGAIESTLSEMVINHILRVKGSTLLSYDSSEILRGYRVIKCGDRFSKDFLGESVRNISDAWKGLKLKMILAREIPRPPRMRIWLPHMTIDNEKLLHYLRLQNPIVPTDDWKIIKAEESENNTMTYLLLINENSAKILEKYGCTLLFGIRHAKVQIFRSVSYIDDLDEVNDTNQGL